MAVPWKRIAVRLDTYSGAPVEFAAYEVDPTDVLVAGNARARAIDTTRRSAVAKWRFTPPPGSRYTPNDVEVPLQNREGFFVVEARRGDAVQQAWLDLTRVGLLTKESPGGIVLYGADLGSGAALAGMRITYLVGTTFEYGKTDVHGIARWSGAQRPRFAIAEWGKSKTFVSLLAQPPVPSMLLGVRAERANLRAGEHVHVVGFARKRTGTSYTGPPPATCAFRSPRAGARSSRPRRGSTVPARSTPSWRCPPTRRPATPRCSPRMPVASGGAAIHVDGVGDVVLAVVAACGDGAPGCAGARCRCARDAPTARRRRAADVRWRVVRAPHVLGRVRATHPTTPRRGAPPRWRTCCYGPTAPA